MDLEEDVSAIEEVSRANWTGDRSSLLRAARGARSFVREAATFHVANTRFWEAVLLPCAVVVVVALSSCMELWLGQCVSLACWYSANYYTMGYTLQVLHPQVSSSTLLRLSPFGGAVQLFLWSVLPALAEVLLLNVMNVPSVAHVAGTTLYAVCGCLWLHVFIAPWQCIPEGWRPHQVFRWLSEDRPLEAKRSMSPDVPPEATDGSPRRRTSDRHARLVERAEGSIAGHAALAIAGYALLTTWMSSITGSLQPAPRTRGAGPGPRLKFHTSRPQPSTTLAYDSVSARPTVQAETERTVVASPLQRDLPSVASNTSELVLSRNWSVMLPQATLGTAVPRRARRLEANRRLPQAAAGLELQEGHAPARLPGRSTSSWDGVVVLGALTLALLMIVDAGKSLEFSVPHLLCYNLMCLRVPDVLGHWVITFVTGLQMSPGTTTTALSLAYMGAMQAYLVVLKWVCRNMSAADMFPRFHFVAQMYYYLFWYMMLMVLTPGGVDDRNFWLLVCFLNGTSLASNAGLLNVMRAFLRTGAAMPDPPLKVLFEAKLAVQDQLADVVSLLVVPAIATSFHICTSLTGPNFSSSPLRSLWQRFLVLLVARLLSGLLTEEIFRRRVDVLNKAEALELHLLPIDGSQNRNRYLSDICIGPKLALEAMRNIERCELYFAAVAVVCTFSVFQRGDQPARYAFISFGM